jgi:hypothetical protein
MKSLLSHLADRPWPRSRRWTRCPAPRRGTRLIGRLRTCLGATGPAGWFARCRLTGTTD